jgi:hypothetical protein
MSEPVTLEDIYQLFRASAEEFDRRLRESDLRRAEMERVFAEAKLESDQLRRRGDRSMIEINQGIDRYAYKKGLFVIKPSGDTVAIINDADFQPNTW